MIEGIKICVTSAELNHLMTDRADYHEQRANQKEAEIPKLEEAWEAIQRVAPNPSVAMMSGKGSYSNSSSNLGDQIESIKTDIVSHRNKTILFRFLASHLFDDNYCLKEEDLVRLEIAKR